VTHDELSRAYRAFMKRLTELLHEHGLDEAREVVDLSADEYELRIAHLGSSLWRATDRESARVVSLRWFPSASDALLDELWSSTNELGPAQWLIT
jgi:hypothetical protein